MKKDIKKEKKEFDWKFFWMTMAWIPIIAFFVCAALFN